MTVKRITTKNKKIKNEDLKKYKDKKVGNLTEAEKDFLIELIARKLNIL